MRLRQTLEENIDWVTFPLLALFIATFAEGIFTPAGLVFVFLGWFTGTYAEYVIHRWVLHGPYWMAVHQRHHENPLEPTRFPLYQTPAYFVAIGLLSRALAGPDYWVAYFEGWVLWYVTFMSMHALEHHAPHLVPQLAINHNAHHKLTEMNFGISVTLWDHVFGTYRAPSKKC